MDAVSEATSNREDVPGSVAFKPPLLLRNRHIMTIAAASWRRSFPEVQACARRELVEVAPEATLAVDYNTSVDNESRRCSLVVIVHGLEGCGGSHYMLGTAAKALACGFDTARVNLRNCGGTLQMCKTLYNAGMSGDVLAVCRDAINRLGYEQIHLVGFSLGGNLVVKAACEAPGETWLASVSAVSPSIDLAACVDALESGQNRIYDRNFLISLKRKIAEKCRFFPGLYDLKRLDSVETVRQFDDAFTAPDGGYRSAEHYYESASAIACADRLDTPTLLVAAQDDPIVPVSSFDSDKLHSDSITVLSPVFGGHSGFVAAACADERLARADRFWAENRVVEFCINNRQPASS